MKVNILGINFDQIDLDGAAKKIEALIREGDCHQVGTINPEYVVKAWENKQLLKAITKMALVVPDGIGIVLAALGKLNRVKGGDLVEKIAALCAEKGDKIGLVGGEEGIAQEALLALVEKFPGLMGFSDSGPRDVEEETREEKRRIVIKIRKERPKILLTAFGFQGPIWIDQLLGELKKRDISLVALEVGGVFNYLAGKAKRPPKIIQKIGLEWLWRLFWEPWRLKRQMALLKFFFLLFQLHPQKP